MTIKVLNQTALVKAEVPSASKFEKLILVKNKPDI
jgi:hypothetical protein